MALAGGNLIHDLGYSSAGMTSSMEMLALCDEAAGIARYLLAGIEVSPRTLALETIEQVGPGGNYMAESHTVENFKGSLHFTSIMNRLEHARWQEAGCTTLQSPDIRASGHYVPFQPARRAIPCSRGRA